MARIEQATGLAGLRMDCPVKDLALTVQHFVDAHQAADKAAVAVSQDKSHASRVEHTRLTHRRNALADLIKAKRDHALTMQAQSPEGALHQIAIVSLYLDNLWDLTPAQEKDSEAYFEAKHAKMMADWGLYSAAALLERLCTEPRDKLAVEYYLSSGCSPFARTGVGSVPDPGQIGMAPERTDRSEKRLVELNQWMDEARATRAAAWRREETAVGEDFAQAESIAGACERDIVAITEEAATIVPRSLRGFALKARLLTTFHGAEETNFSSDQEALYRSLIGQLLAAADLARIDDGMADARDFLARSNAFLSAEAA